VLTYCCVNQINMNMNMNMNMCKPSPNYYILHTQPHVFQAMF